MNANRFLPICLWSGPRNISTALMYSFRQRPDTRVVDEPLYGHYLRVSGANHPGRDQVLEQMNLDGDRVMSSLLERRDELPVLFMKQMAHHLVGLNRSFLEKTVNVLLIRDPEEMPPSLTIQLPDAGLADTGLSTQLDLLNELEGLGQHPAVLDSRELLLNPEHVLHKLCEQLDIPFYPQMLSWPKGPIPEDGVWAQHWYHNVHESTAFQPYRRKTSSFPENLKQLLDICNPYYKRLLKNVIRAE